MKRLLTGCRLLPLTVLCSGCFPVASAPRIVRISDLLTQREDYQAREIAFPVS